MTYYEMKELSNNLETARILAGAEMERLCNEHEYIDACIFQSVRDSIAQNIQLVHSYINCKRNKGEKEE